MTVSQLLNIWQFFFKALCLLYCVLSCDVCVGITFLVTNHQQVKAYDNCIANVYIVQEDCQQIVLLERATHSLKINLLFCLARAPTSAYWWRCAQRCICLAEHKLCVLREDHQNLLSMQKPSTSLKILALKQVSKAQNILCTLLTSSSGHFHIMRDNIEVDTERERETIAVMSTCYWKQYPLHLQ